MNSNIVPIRPTDDAPTPFDFDGQQVRVIDIDGEPWFVAADVCKVLEIGNPSQAVTRLDEDERTLISNEGRSINAVSEPGLYSLIGGSRKPEAKAFIRWVNHDVLPQIRKTGGYGQPVKELTFEEMVERTLLESRARIQALESENQQLAPKANAWERFCSSTGDMSCSEAAKALERGGFGVGGLHKLYAICDKKREDGGLGWFFRNGHGEREAYQRVVDQGLIRMKSSSVENSRTGEMFISLTPRFTAKALDAIAKHITSKEISA